MLLATPLGPFFQRSYTDHHATARIVREQHISQPRINEQSSSFNKATPLLHLASNLVDASVEATKLAGTDEQRYLLKP